MHTPRTLFALIVLAMLPACRPSAEAQSPTAAAPSGAAASSDSSDSTGAVSTDPPTSTTSTGAEAAPTAKEGAAKPEPGAGSDVAPSESMTLARDFLKSGGRRIGYSASKKTFAYPVEHRKDTGFGLDIQFVGQDGQPRDAMRVCQIGECEESLDEIAKELLPKLASRIEQDGYVAIRGIGWPSGRDELEVSSLSMKLKYTKGRIDALREGKPPARLTQVGGRRLDAATLLAVFVVSDAKLLGVFAPPGADAKGLVQDFFIFKLP